MPRLLGSDETAERLKALDGWTVEGKFIVKNFAFGSFAEAIKFVDTVAAVAEEEDHHPDIHVRYSEVKLAIQTHSEGGLTEWDFELAKAIDEKTGK